MQNILPASFKTLELVWSEVQTLILSRTQHPSANQPNQLSQPSGVLN